MDTNKERRFYKNIKLYEEIIHEIRNANEWKIGLKELDPKSEDLKIQKLGTIIFMYTDLVYIDLVYNQKLLWTII